MNKKPLCGILATAILFGACPVSAFAADEPMEITNWVMDFRNNRKDCEGDGWEWDSRSQMLILEDFHAVVPEGKMEKQAAIFLPDESTIYLEGDDNEINTYSYHCAGIYCEGELYISGDGKLKITTDSFGASAIYVDHGPLIFDEKVEVTIEPAGYVIYVDEAKGKNPVISVQDKAKVIFPDDCTDRNITVTHKSSVTPSDNWLDYSEEHDKDEETITLVKKTQKTTPEKEPEKENPAKTDEYQITVGSPSIVKNGKISYTADVSPYLSNGYTMLPLRALLEVSNPEQEVKWSAEQKAAYTFVNNKLVVITPGQDTYKKGSEKIELSTPAETKNGRLFVSLRDWMSIMEIDGSQLDWDSKTKTVTLKY